MKMPLHENSVHGMGKPGGFHFLDMLFSDIPDPDNI